MPPGPWSQTGNVRQRALHRTVAKFNCRRRHHAVPCGHRGWLRFAASSGTVCARLELRKTLQSADALQAAIAALKPSKRGGSAQIEGLASARVLG